MANTPQLNKEILDSLSPEEREVALKALQELSTQGVSKTLEDLRYRDFKEVPVDIETFITDDRYLGKAWKDAEGKLKLYPFWMDRLKELFPDNLTTAYNTLLESGARGIGKAQPITEPVLTSKGFIPMGEVQLGDQVYGRDGKLHEVIGVFPQGKKCVYRVTFSDKSSTLCCKEHLWEIHTKTEAYRKNKGYNVARRVVPLEWLFDKPLKRYHSGKWERQFFIPTCDPVQFPYQEVPIHPYLLGCLLGDGSLRRGDIRITSGDPEILDRLQQIISEEDSNYYLRQHTSAKASQLDYSLVRHEVPKIWNEEFHLPIAAPNIFAQRLEELGVLQSATNKFIPDKYLYNNVEVRLQLLQGLMDTDGTITKDGSTITFDTISPQLRDGVVWLVQSLGGTAFYGERHPYYRNAEGQKVSGNTSYCVRIKLPQSTCPFSLPRKVERMQKARKNPSRYIESIERVDQQECQCILLNSDDHLYLTRDFIVTHNSEIACGCVGAYLLYRVMCLKNPLEYFHLKQTEKICFAFMNIKLALAEEIAISKFQKTIQMSPWFMERGTMTSYKNNPYWNPPDPISFIIGSQADDVIGQPIYFCLDGDTIIITDKGDVPIKDLVDIETRVPTVDSSGNIVTSEMCTVRPTAVVQDYMELTLEDGTILRCSLNHKFMLSDGSYKEAQYLTAEDDILMKLPFGYIYKFTNLQTGKLYVGKRECPHFDENYWGSEKRWLEDLGLYGKDKIKREIICWANSRKELRELEVYYIAKFDAQNPEIGYNIHRGGAGGNSLGDTAAWSRLHRGTRNGRYGVPASQHTRELISIANTGRHYSEEVNKKKGRPGVPKPPGFGDKISAAQKGRIKSPLELQHLREPQSVTAAKNRGKHIYNDGEHEIRLYDYEAVPAGYVRGRLPKISELAKTNCMLPRGNWYNNGVKEVLSTTCPNGFVPGRLKR